MVLGLSLLILGGVIGVGSFIYTLRNATNQVAHILDSNDQGDVMSRGGQIFSGHITAMIGMAVGSLIGFIGLIILIIQIVERLAA